MIVTDSEEASHDSRTTAFIQSDGGGLLSTWVVMLRLFVLKETVETDDLVQLPHFTEEETKRRKV